MADEGLLAELSSIRFGYDPSGRIKLESKDETRKRVGHSPDLADAVALGFPGWGGADYELPELDPVAWWGGLEKESSFPVEPSWGPIR